MLLDASRFYTRLFTLLPIAQHHNFEESRSFPIPLYHRIGLETFPRLRCSCLCKRLASDCFSGPANRPTDAVRGNFSLVFWEHIFKYFLNKFRYNVWQRQRGKRGGMFADLTLRVNEGELKSCVAERKEC